MSPDLRAQLWEFGRTWRDLAFRLVLGVGFVMFDYYLIHSNSLDIMDFRGSMLMLLLWNAIPSNATTNDLTTVPAGFSTRHFYTRPITAFQMVAVPLLFCVFAGLVCFLFSASLFLWLLETSFPLGGLSASVACVTCCCFALAWTPASVAGRWIACILTHVALFSLCMGGFSELGEPVYWDFPWFGYVGLALVSAIAIAFTVLGVQRRRCGESIWSWSHRLPSSVEPKRGHELREGAFEPFRNLWMAHCWYEFHRIGRFMIYAVFLTPMAILAFVGIFNYFDPDVEACLGMFAGSLACCPFVYQVFGVGATTGLRLRDGAVAFQTYDATIPMRCDHLIAMKLLFVTVWTLLGWLLMAGAWALYTPYIGDGLTFAKLSEALSATTDGKVSAYAWVAVTIVAMPLLMSATPLIVALGYFAHNPARPLRSVFVTIFVVVHLVLFVFTLVDLIPGPKFNSLLPVDLFWWVSDLWSVYGYLFPVVAIGWCANALKQSIGSEFVGKPYLVGSLSLWAVFACTMIALAVMLTPAMPYSIPLWAKLAGVGALLVPLAATLSAPMEMAAHRHA